MKKSVVPLMLLCQMAALLLASGAEDDPQELVTLRSSYHGQIAAIEQDHKHELKNAPRQYAESLKSLEKTFQMAGDLRSLLAVRKESARFADNPTIKAIKLVDTPAKLRSLQENFLKDYRNIGVNKARRILELTQRYSARLATLQRKLTQKGRIEDALKVMHEAENLPKTRAVKAAQFEIAARGEAIVDTADEPRSTIIDTEALSRRLRGHILSWNSQSRKLSVKYDFSDENQLADWPGGTMGVLDRINCETNEVWLTPKFDRVTRVDFDGYLYDGPGYITLKVGEGLTAQIGAGEENSQRLIYQNSEHYPLLSGKDGARPRLRYSVSIEISNGIVRWQVNGQDLGSARLPVPLTFPARIGLGHEASHTAYDNVIISGFLSEGYLSSLGQ